MTPEERKEANRAIARFMDWVFYICGDECIDPNCPNGHWEDEDGNIKPLPDIFTDPAYREQVEERLLTQLIWKAYERCSLDKNGEEYFTVQWADFRSYRNIVDIPAGNGPTLAEARASAIAAAVEAAQKEGRT